MSTPLTSAAPRPTLLRRAIALLCAVLMVALPATAQPQAERTLGADSPQALFDSLRTAGEAEDFPGMVSLVAPEDRAFLSMMMVMMIGMVMAFSQMSSGMAESMAEGMGAEMDAEEKARMEAEKAAAMAQVEEFEAKFESVLKEYGVEQVLEQQSEDPEELMQGVDQVGLLSDLMALMDELPGEEGSTPTNSPVDVPEGDLENLRIDGDTATASVAGEPMNFVKVDGRWYLSLGLKEQMQQQMGGQVQMDIDPEVEPEADSDSP